MEHHGEDARMRRLRAAREAALAQVWAVETLAGEWEKAAWRHRQAGSSPRSPTCASAGFRIPSEPGTAHHELDFRVAAGRRPEGRLLRHVRPGVGGD
jgi:hypothetical protein